MRIASTRCVLKKSFLLLGWGWELWGSFRRNGGCMGQVGGVEGWLVGNLSMGSPGSELGGFRSAERAKLG